MLFIITILFVFCRMGCGLLVVLFMCLAPLLKLNYAWELTEHSINTGLGAHNPFHIRAPVHALYTLPLPALLLAGISKFYVMNRYSILSR